MVTARVELVGSIGVCADGAYVRVQVGRSETLRRVELSPLRLAQLVASGASALAQLVHDREARR